MVECGSLVYIGTCFFLNSSLQKISDYTEDDNTIQVFAKCDDFIEALCKRIKVEIPPFVLYRRAKVAAHREEESGKVVITVTGMDVDENLPYSFIKVKHESSL